MIAPAYWLRSATRARQSQRMSLELALMNPRGSNARKAWLESARIDASRKRQAVRNALEAYQPDFFKAGYGDEYGAYVSEVA